MTTITLKIDRRKKEAQALLEFLEKLPYVEIEKEQESLYSAEFDKKIKKAELAIKKGKTTRIDPENVWESIL